MASCWEQNATLGPCSRQVVFREKEGWREGKQHFAAKIRMEEERVKRET